MSDSPTSSTFAQRLVTLRNARNLNQVECAEQSGVGKSTISRLEAAENEPTLTTIARLAQFFGCTADYLVGLTDYPERLPPHYWLVDAALHARVLAGDVADIPANEQFAAPIPVGARIVDSATYHRMLTEARTALDARKRKRK